MKNKFLKIATISTIFAFGIGLLAVNNNAPIEVKATAHADNYADYTYSGSYYSFLTNEISQYTEGLNGTLRTSLSSNILPKAWFTYSGSNSNQLGSVLQSSDQDPNNSSNMILFYTRDSITKRAAGGNVSDWNREHVWPQDLSNDHWGKTQAGADVLHIRPTWSKTNSARGNKKYGDLGKKNPQQYEGMLYAYTDGSLFEPIDTVKGDVARILMYVWTAYYDYYKDNGLLLTKVIESYDTLLKWHTLDKPDVLEGNRNDFSETSKQKNRNPFVDHPEYAWKIFGDSASLDVKNSCKAAYPDGGSADIPPGPSSSSSSAPNSSELPSSTSSVISSSDEVTSTNTTISSSEEISSSIEISISSSEETTTPESSNIEESSENNDGDKKKKNAGCNGSLVILPVASLSALIGLVFVLSKRKK